MTEEIEGVFSDGMVSGLDKRWDSLEEKKAYLREVFGEEKFERMLKEAKEFFTLSTKKSRKQVKEATKELLDGV